VLKYTNKLFLFVIKYAKNKNRSKVSTRLFETSRDELFFCIKKTLHGVSKAFLRFSEIRWKKKFQISKYFWNQNIKFPPSHITFFSGYNFFPPKFLKFGYTHSSLVR